jgi:OmpA-OmpF porin, OOP family
MQKLPLTYLLIIFSFCVSKAQNQALYYFDNGLKEFTGKYPALVFEGEKGIFIDEVIEKFGKEPRKVYQIPKNSGLTFENSKIKNFIKGSYGIEMYFKYDDGSLLIYNQLLGNDLYTKQGNYIHLVTTRNTKTNQVNIFLDGNLRYNFIDTEKNLEIDQKSEVDFFFDASQKTTSGAVAMIKLYDYFIDETTAKDIFRVFSETPIKIEAQPVGIINNLYFVQSLAKILPESLPELENIFDFLNKNINLKIELLGHTDNQGDFSLNMQLSKDRATAVKNYLVKKGIAEKRIKIKGYGSTKPIASNTSELTRPKNRRVEMLILK